MVLLARFLADFLITYLLVNVSLLTVFLVLGNPSFLEYLGDPYLDLYSLYINDLPDCLRFSRVAMFADDTKCYQTICSREDSSNLQSDLTGISNWVSLNELSFQPKKCESLHISRKRFTADRAYSLNDNQLKNG